MNEVTLSGEGWYVSYNDRPWSADCKAETALVVDGKEKTYYFILNGDHRNKLPKTFEDVVSYFYTSQARSSWSDDMELLRRYMRQQ